MQQDRQVLLVAFQALQESARSIKRIVSSPRAKGELDDRLSALSDALSQVAAEMSLLAQFGDLYSADLETISRATLELVERTLSESDAAHEIAAASGSSLNVTIAQPLRYLAQYIDEATRVRGSNQNNSS